ncbi:hypothetical protein C8F01DRAFT_1082200 [Mycena amicta]|nr:hypothetical protein C8F01DRAFT_1082200 [Mycena amicta]
MHPSLALSNLSELPLHLKVTLSLLWLLHFANFRPQKRAKSAAAGSLQDLLFITSLKATIPKTKSLLLPVYYALLDPKDITTLRDLDSLHIDDATERIKRVVLALGCLDDSLCQNVVPEAAQPDLWARAWPWIQFLVEFDLSPSVWPSRGTAQEARHFGLACQIGLSRLAEFEFGWGWLFWLGLGL